MKYWKYAQSACSHYNKNGPDGKKDYCFQEGIKCNLHPAVDMGCYFYVNCVLPANKKLEAEWQTENPVSGI